MDIQWEDPAPIRRGGSSGNGRHQLLVKELQAYPGRWARASVRSAGSDTSTSLLARQHPGTEWTVRKQPSGENVLYVRWVGVP